MAPDELEVRAANDVLGGVDVEDACCSDTETQHRSEILPIEQSLASAFKERLYIQQL